jgi:hypothetical protein
MFWVWHHVDSYINANISEKHIICNFRSEVVTTGSGKISTGKGEEEWANKGKRIRGRKFWAILCPCLAYSLSIPFP